MSRKTIMYLVLLAGCSTEPADPNERTYLNEITGGVHASFSEPSSLCELVRLATRVGVFDVDEIYVQAEVVDSTGHTNPFTYIELSPVEDWKGSGPIIIVRTPGGPIWRKQGRQWVEMFQPWEVSLKKGETVVYMETWLPGATEPYPGIWDNSVFRETGGGFQTERLLFADAPILRADFKAMVTAIAAVPDDAPCPVDAYVKGWEPSGQPNTDAADAGGDTGAPEPDMGN